MHASSSLSGGPILPERNALFFSTKLIPDSRQSLRSFAAFFTKFTINLASETAYKFVVFSAKNKQSRQNLLIRLA